MSREQVLQAQVVKMQKTHAALEKRFKALVDALYDTQILFDGRRMDKYEFFIVNICIWNRLEDICQRQELISDHLGMEFEKVECEDHYELKKKEEKEK